MTTNTNESGNNGFLYFVVGALTLAVAGFGVYYFGGFDSGASGDADISVSVDENGFEVDG